MTSNLPPELQQRVGRQQIYDCIVRYCRERRNRRGRPACDAAPVLRDHQDEFVPAFLRSARPSRCERKPPSQGIRYSTTRVSMPIGDCSR